MYHELETSPARYQFNAVDFHKSGNEVIPPCTHEAESPTHSESDSSACDPPPIYQDITDIPLVRDRRNGRISGSGQEACSPSTEVESKPSELPVYQEIVESPPSRASSRLHDNIPSVAAESNV